MAYYRLLPFWDLQRPTWRHRHRGTLDRLGAKMIIRRRQPRVSGGVLAGVVRVEVDEDPLDLPVTDLEHVAPAPGTPLRYTGPPGPVLVLSVTGALADHDVAAGEDPVEVGVVVLDLLDRG